MSEILTAALLISGLAAMVWGVYVIFPAAAFIVGGFLVMTIAFALSQGKDDN